MSSPWDLDPHLVKCIEFLHKSKKLRKGDQPPLQKMLEEALYEKYGIKKDYTQFFQSHLPPREPGASTSRESQNHESVALNDGLIVIDSDEDFNTDDDRTSDETLENLLGGDLMCVKCKQMTVEANNCLLECLECRYLYHQLCHQPPVTRLVEKWICMDCRNLNYARLIEKDPAKIQALQEKRIFYNSRNNSPYSSPSPFGSCYSGDNSENSSPNVNSLYSEYALSFYNPAPCSVTSDAVPKNRTPLAKKQSPAQNPSSCFDTGSRNSSPLAKKHSQGPNSSSTRVRPPLRPPGQSRHISPLAKFSHSETQSCSSMTRHTTATRPPTSSKKYR